jgi:hypothetical protein
LESLVDVLPLLIGGSEEGGKLGPAPLFDVITAVLEAGSEESEGGRRRGGAISERMLVQPDALELNG